MVKNLSYVSCAARNVFSINSLCPIKLRFSEKAIKLTSCVSTLVVSHSEYPRDKPFLRTMVS